VKIEESISKAEDYCSRLHKDDYSRSDSWEAPRFFWCTIDEWTFCSLTALINFPFLRQIELCPEHEYLVFDKKEIDSANQNLPTTYYRKEIDSMLATREKRYYRSLYEKRRWRSSNHTHSSQSTLMEPQVELPQSWMNVSIEKTPADSRKSICIYAGDKK